MKNVKKLLIFAAISTFVFASSTRTDALGGAGYWADDYSNIAAFPASVNDHNVAWTDGSNFTSVFDKDGTTWGFAGGTGNDVANIMWGNGSMGVTFGLNMTPEVTAEDVLKFLIFNKKRVILRLTPGGIVIIPGNISSRICDDCMDLIKMVNERGHQPFRLDRIGQVCRL